MVALDHGVPERHADAVGAVADALEALFEVAARCLDRLAPVGLRLGMCRRVRDRDGDDLRLVAAREVDREVERPERRLRSVPGDEDAPEHQGLRVGMSASTASKTSRM
jgi:hypothetical protein